LQTRQQKKQQVTARYCALSLVGEPIMYPQINALVDEPHHRHIYDSGYK
jgi:tRNA wybutosine-synthesizing protein 1